jgi:CubicO group peptidase (beta-lactamase class C family)
MRTSLRLALLLALVVPALTRTQERTVVGGPPPEIRTLVDGFLKAVNSASADEFEAMAKAHFSPKYLASQTATQRSQLQSDIRKQLGTVTMERARRQGPDEPLELHVKGSTGATGVIVLTMDAEQPFKVGGVKLETVAGRREGRGGPPMPASAPIDPGMSDAELERALDAYLSRLASEDTLSGAVLVARQGRPIVQKAYGFADRANRIPNTTGTRFNLGSINKKFTEIAIAQLVAAGKLATTDTLGALIPDYPQALSRTATVAQLLGHTAGLSDFFGEEFSKTSKDRFRSNADYFSFVSRLPPLFAPGERNQYCNGCYITLGAIIERISGMPYERYVAERIFTPVGMKSTGYIQSDGIEAGVATGYTRRAGDGQLRSNIFMHGAAGSAAGGGYSTLADLLAFDIALRGGRIPGAKSSGGLGIAGGAPGINAIIESNAVWTVIVLGNLDPPSAQSVGRGIMTALAGRRE